MVNTNVTTATTTTDWMLQLALAKIAHSISKQGCKFKQELNIHQNKENDKNIFTKHARDIKKTVNAEKLRQIKQYWENKPLHGKYLLESQSTGVDKGNAHQWLRGGGKK